MSNLNEHLEHRVTQSLLTSDRLSSQRIGVAAENGVVTLSGEVQSFRRKLAAQQTAETCPGVNSVNNQLAVAPPEPVTDPEIARKINRRLSQGSNLADHSIRVDVRNGLVTLTGYVSQAGEKILAADVAASVDGVRDVQNMLIVNGDYALGNEEHCVAIQAALQRTIGMEDANITLSVVDETARLSGHVDALWKKEAAEKTVRQFGILALCNDIIVEPSGAPTAQTGE